MSKFDGERIKRIVALAEATTDIKKRQWTSSAVFERLDKAIIGNHRYKQTLAMCLSGYLSERKQRDHLLVFGPSGSGKTYLIEQCLPDFNVPFIFIDASSLTPAGIKGNNLSDSLTEFYRTNSSASERAVIVLDEFDKLSEKANGGDTQKSQSIQSELLTSVQGKLESGIDTRNSLWIFLGAFSFADEMKLRPPKISKNDLLKYGFKNELLGRITRDTMTDIPSLDDVVRQVINHPVFTGFFDDLRAEDYNAQFEDAAVAELAKAALDVRFGMRIIPSILGTVKEEIIFKLNAPKGELFVTASMIKQALERLN